MAPSLVVNGTAVPSVTNGSYRFHFLIPPLMIPSPSLKPTNTKAIQSGLECPLAQSTHSKLALRARLEATLIFTVLNCASAIRYISASAITPANRKRSQTASNDFCSRLPQDLPAQRLFAKNVAGSDISTQEVVLLLLGDKLFRYSRANTPLVAKRRSCFCRQRQWLSNTDFSNPIEPVERKSSPVSLCVAQGLKFES
jgi:hypothetical protein